MLVHWLPGLAAGLAAGLFCAQASGQILNNSSIHPHVPLPSEIQYSFSDDDLARLASQEGVGVIIHHGVQMDIGNFAVVHSHTERLDFFISQPINTDTVSADVVRAIMSGEVTNWTELGGSDHPINVYAPAADLQRAGVAAQMRRAGVYGALLGEARTTYAELADALLDDPGAFVVGLRSEAAWRESLAGAQRISPLIVNGQAAFVSPIQIYVKSGDSAAAEAAADLLAMVEARAAQDRLAYPRLEKMQALGLTD